MATVCVPIRILIKMIILQLSVSENGETIRSEWGRKLNMVVKPGLYVTTIFIVTTPLIFWSRYVRVYGRVLANTKYNVTFRS